MSRLDAILQQISDSRTNPPVHQWHPKQIAEISICIRRNGEWLHQGSVIQRKKLVKLFASILRKDEDQYYLVTSVEKCRIDVESTPFVVTFAELIDDRWFITNNLDETVELSQQDIQWLDAETPVVLWRDQLPARISQSVMYQLQVYALEHGGLKDGKLWLKTGDGQIVLPEE